MDGLLLELFNYTKSLEEIDRMDKFRLSRALTALRYRDAWQRQHNRMDGEREKRLLAEQEQRDKELTRELIHLLMSES